MKTIIIRKPKFMRDDNAMRAYIKVYCAMVNSMDDNASLEDTIDDLSESAKILNKAAKAGGFLSTKDFLRWVEKQSKN